MKLKETEWKTVSEREKERARVLDETENRKKEIKLWGRVKIDRKKENRKKEWKRNEKKKRENKLKEN